MRKFRMAKCEIDWEVLVGHKLNRRVVLFDVAAYNAITQPPKKYPPGPHFLEGRKDLTNLRSSSFPLTAYRYSSTSGAALITL